MIVKIGGCNGSGKTSVVRALMISRHFVPVHWHGNMGKVKEYVYEPHPDADVLGKVFDKVVVLGDYRNVCGGMDTISDKEVRYAMVEKYCTFNAQNRNTLVIFEGLITGKTYGALGVLSEACRIPWLYLFMDTPFDTCVQRVLERRKVKGNDAPFDPERTMRPTYKSCLSTQRRAKDSGHFVATIDHTLLPMAAASQMVNFALFVTKKGTEKDAK